LPLFFVFSNNVTYSPWSLAFLRPYCILLRGIAPSMGYFSSFFRHVYPDFLKGAVDPPLENPRFMHAPPFFLHCIRFFSPVRSLFDPAHVSPPFLDAPSDLRLVSSAGKEKWFPALPNGSVHLRSASQRFLKKSASPPSRVPPEKLMSYDLIPTSMAEILLCQV